VVVNLGFKRVSGGKNNRLSGRSSLGTNQKARPRVIGIPHRIAMKDILPEADRTDSRQEDALNRGLTRQQQSLYPAEEKTGEGTNTYESTPSNAMPKT